MRSAALVAVAGATLAATAAAARPEPGARGRPRTRNLFASAGLLLQANNVVCGLANIGEVCVAFIGSPVGGGGFWPKGTPDQYIFNSGLQLAGRVASGAGFTWAGDTIGAFFFDPRGTQVQGDGITGVFDGVNTADINAWPVGAVVRDTAIYNDALIGRPTISQQDSWVRYWEGDPTFLSGRTHPMGILVEQRSLAWNYPVGNEDILYFIFTFYNVTARGSSGAYNNPTVYPEVQAEIAAIGDRFQDLNEAKFGIGIPDGGYAITDLYAAFAMDNDVAVFSHNYSTAVLPFNLGTTYTGDFLPEVGWQFPPAFFGAPFAAAPGFVAAKYLRSPESSPGVQVGLTMFSNTLNAATGFPDAVGVNQLFRYLSGFLGPADNPCNVNPNPAIARQRRLCFLATQQADSRFYQASGPFTLPPGESRTIVVAYVHAAPLAAPLAALPGGGIGGDNPPGIPFTGDSIFLDAAKVRPIDRVMGWVSHSDADTNFAIEQGEVVTAPRSLLNKANRAQAVFDAGFLLPFAPEAPDFFLIPGNNQVTVVWKASRTEDPTVGGDPYFAVASAPLKADLTPNPLYDPNFRKFDVEGYRIYRGRTAGDLELIAQFDYAGTSLIDYTGNFDYGDENGDGLAQCAPELGLMADCPVAFDTIPPNTGPAAEHPLLGNIIQVIPGGRVELASGSVFILSADTAVVGGGSGNKPLEDTGVPFSFLDTDVRNSFTYHYTVTAFDVNSLASGPTSIESARITKRVTPRVHSGQETAGLVTPPVLLDRSGAPLNLSTPVPGINPATGIFSGPMPPTDGFDAGLAVFAAGVIQGSGAGSVVIDSIVPGSALQGVPATYYITGQGSGSPVKFALPLLVDAFNANASNFTFFPAFPVVTGRAARFGGDNTYNLSARVDLASSGTWRLSSWGRANINATPTLSAFNGPRWWAGAPNENTNDPNLGLCPGSEGNCGTGGLAPMPNVTRSAGSLPGVDTLFHVHAYATVQSVPMRNLEGITAGVTRAADFRVYWGAAGAIDSVIDVTHNYRVPFHTGIRASWGLLTQASFTGLTAASTPDGNISRLTWSDIFCVDPAPDYLGNCTVTAPLQNTASLSPINAATASFAGTATQAAGAAGGNGFIFYLNGHFFLMQMTGSALPAAGTVWNARFYAGTVRRTAAGVYSFVSRIRPPTIPGLRAEFQYEASVFDSTADTDMDRIHTVPDPYYVTNALEITANQKFLKFVNLPARAIIRIYSVSGVLVTVIAHDDEGAGGEATWNLRNRNNQFVASGVYFYHVETPTGRSKVGRFTVVNFAP